MKRRKSNNKTEVNSHKYDSNQNDACSNKNQPEEPVSNSEFLFFEDDTFPNDLVINTDLNSNPSIRSESYEYISEDVTDNVNNLDNFSDEEFVEDYVLNRVKYRNMCTFYIPDCIYKNHSNAMVFNKCKNKIRSANNILKYSICRAAVAMFNIVIFILKKIKNKCLDYFANYSFYLIIHKVFAVLQSLFNCSHVNIFHILFLGVLVVLVFIAGCFHSDRDTIWIDKSESVLLILKTFYLEFLNDLQNMANIECLYENNCCSTKKSYLLRWMFCVIKQPYTVAVRTEGGYRKRKIKTLKDYHFDLMDWRLRKQVKSLNQSLESVIKSVELFNNKSLIFKNSLEESKNLFFHNLSKINNLEEQYDTIGRMFNETLKDFDELKADIMLLSDIWNKLTKLNSEIKSCSKCSLKSTKKETDSQMKSNNKINKEIFSRINELKFKFETKVPNGRLNKRIGELEEELSRYNTDNHKLQPQISDLDNLYIHIKTERKNLIKYVQTQQGLNTVKYKDSNRNTVNKFQVLYITMENQLKNCKKDNKNYIKNIIPNTYSKWEGKMRTLLLKKLLKNLESQIKATVQNTLNLNMDEIKKCSIVFVENEYNRQITLFYKKIIIPIFEYKCLNPISEKCRIQKEF